MPPPVPPSVKAGRTIAGRPIVGERLVGGRSAGLGGGALDDEAGGVGLADPVEQVAERLAVLGHPDGLERRAEQADGVTLEDAGFGESRGQVQRGLAAETGQQPFRLLLRDHRLDRLDGQRLEVDRVGDLGVGHDRRRVAVDQDRPDALGAEGAAGLGAGVVELGGLADHDRPGAEDQDGRGLAADGLGRSRPAAQRGDPARSAARATNRSNTARASSGPGAPSGWYWTVSIGSVAWRRPSTEPSFRLTWLTWNPEPREHGLPDHLDLVVLGRHLDQSQLDVADRMVCAVVPEPEPRSSPRRRLGPRSGGRGRCRAAAGRRR